MVTHENESPIYCRSPTGVHNDDKVLEIDPELRTTATFNSTAAVAGAAVRNWFLYTHHVGNPLKIGLELRKTRSTQLLRLLLK